MKAKYDIIGDGYNVSRSADPYLANRFLQLLDTGKNGLWLDIGCGTGNYTSELQQKGLRFIGIDPSVQMITEAGKKNKMIDWRVGTAENTGLDNHSVDGIMGSLTIHHWSDFEKAFSELSRIMKANSRIVIFTATPAQMEGYWLNHYFPEMLKASIDQMPSFERVRGAMESAGIRVISTEKYFVQPHLQDYFLYCGKQRPELYFEERVRRGISSFSALANQQEVEAGLLALRKDVDSGEISSVIASYQNNEGDYLFIAGQKISS
ncbi:class I SAM-dependent methyltransferase [Cesiribacter sp. SM1]|uniref:class I SAM-dependent methyltransferase n=1 Tax=Cesiribacter sp. SM1 TaxID=2861196 RepID=UPI001CD49864|nr:class I SAM-dependent methyltransferase [Cesiribacter sp. SM1]